MGQFKKVFKRFDYANISVDYKRKTVDVTYPDKGSWWEDVVMFTVVGLFAVVPFTLFIGFILMLFDIEGWGIQIFLLSYIVWMIYCYKGTRIRKMLIETGEEKGKFNHVILTGNIKKRKVVLDNVGNYLTSYEATGDYKNYLEKFQIRCVKLNKERKLLWDTKVSYVWQIALEFSKIPRTGQMIISNQRGGLDEIKGTGIVSITYD